LPHFLEGDGSQSAHAPLMRDALTQTTGDVWLQQAFCTVKENVILVPASIRDETVNVT
jgi:hypothetical protein